MYQTETQQVTRTSRSGGAANWHVGATERAVLFFIAGVLTVAVLLGWLILSGRHGLAGFLLLGGALAGGVVAAVVLFVLSRVVFTINLRR